MKTFKNILILAVILCYALNLSAQNKVEKESRIEVDELPQTIVTVLSTLPEDAKRIRYYKETDGDKHSFESKFKFRRHWHSVEFSNFGILEDIEITVKERDIPDLVKLVISNYLNAQSQKFNFIKIQEQYIFDPNQTVIPFLNSVVTNRMQMQCNYEIIVALKQNTVWQLKEMTFDSKGEFMNSRTIQPDSYEYIMY
ncbi:hypothetical protein [Psychroserpens sp.]|uniref:hypothetical protein n=1 Tax=Psychroserpens sp. TaxID=2020870 RepID=UPI003C74C6B5